MKEKLQKTDFEMKRSLLFNPLSTEIKNYKYNVRDLSRT